MWAITAVMTAVAILITEVSSNTAATGTDTTFLSEATRISISAVEPGRRSLVSPSIFTTVAYFFALDMKLGGSGWFATELTTP